MFAVKPESRKMITFSLVEVFCQNYFHLLLISSNFSNIMTSVINTY